MPTSEPGKIAIQVCHRAEADIQTNEAYGAQRTPLVSLMATTLPAPRTTGIRPLDDPPPPSD